MASRGKGDLLPSTSRRIQMMRLKIALLNRRKRYTTMYSARLHKSTISLSCSQHDTSILDVKILKQKNSSLARALSDSRMLCRANEDQNLRLRRDVHNLEVETLMIKEEAGRMAEAFVEIKKQIDIASGQLYHGLDTFCNTSELVKSALTKITFSVPTLPSDVSCSMIAAASPKIVGETAGTEAVQQPIVHPAYNSGYLSPIVERSHTILNNSSARNSMIPIVDRSESGDSSAMPTSEQNSATHLETFIESESMHTEPLPSPVTHSEILTAGAILAPIIHADVNKINSDLIDTSDRDLENMARRDSDAQLPMIAPDTSLRDSVLPVASTDQHQQTSSNYIVKQSMQSNGNVQHSSPDADSDDSSVIQVYIDSDSSSVVTLDQLMRHPPMLLGGETKGAIPKRARSVFTESVLPKEGLTVEVSPKGKKVQMKSAIVTLTRVSVLASAPKTDDTNFMQKRMKRSSPLSPPPVIELNGVHAEDIQSTDHDSSEDGLVSLDIHKAHTQKLNNPRKTNILKPIYNTNDSSDDSDEEWTIPNKKSRRVKQLARPKASPQPKKKTNTKNRVEIDDIIDNKPASSVPITSSRSRRNTNKVVSYKERNVNVKLRR